MQIGRTLKILLCYVIDLGAVWAFAPIGKSQQINSGRKPGQGWAAARGRVALRALERKAGEVVSLADGDAYAEAMQQVPEGDVVVIKFWAPWCRACKGLEPKFKRMAQLYPDFNFQQLNWEENRAFCKTIGVTALPLVKFVTSEGEVESFPCGPKKVELLRGKLDEWSLKQGFAETAVAEAPAAPEAPAEPKAPEASAPDVADGAEAPAGRSSALPKVGGGVITDMRRLNGKWLKAVAPALFAQLPDPKANELVMSAVVNSYEDGDLITEQGSEGSRIYIILSGECDVFKQSGYGGFAERTAWGVPVNTLPAGAVT